MSIITFTSDFGKSDHYVASVKAALLSKNSNAQIVDLSHDIKPFDLPHLAFVIKSVFREFPKGTIHLVGLNDTNTTEEAYIGVELEGHFFLLPDNGLIGLLSDQPPSSVVKLTLETTSLFPTKEILAPIALAMASGEQLKSFGNLTSDYKQMLTRQVKATRKEISGHVIRVDEYGNLITNIQQLDFDILSKEKSFVIQIGKETSRVVHKKYQDVEPGDLFFIFNTLKVLEIGMYQGNASQLLGLEFDAPVNIQFDE